MILNNRKDMQYITIKDAMKSTGKSERTIRTFIKNAPEEHVKRNGRNVMVSTGYLHEAYQPIAGNDTGNDNEIIELLKSENEYLRKKLDKAENMQDKLIDNLRVEQIKTLSDQDKRDIIQALKAK